MSIKMKPGGLNRLNRLEEFYAGGLNRLEEFYVCYKLSKSC
ncbi:hypothetical protein LTSEINV_2640 [Salmonella enterica subsp. enterica serovar Inverness str. R8-3668]|uniref:Uncharacterized protein n=1 Tax=Salmonella enterica subsp. enterica serovar Inverness str. R8-3668 TaxID=913075 RepID=G5NDB8_SALET|nr:hypothetical protein LTSEINV_2640 [Salmonella enterica subsp. enterica serovar Inverness str. R8-3668]